LGFTPGENLDFGMFAKLVDFGLGDQIVREDDLDLLSTLSCNGFDLTDGGANPIPFSLREKWRVHLPILPVNVEPYERRFYRGSPSIAVPNSCSLSNNDLRVRVLRQKIK